MAEIQISLASARVNAGLTQEQVAKHMRVSKTTIINWENHKREPRISDMRKLCELYKIPIENISN